MANPSVTPKVPRDGTVTFFDNAGISGANTMTWDYIMGDVSVNAGAKEEFIDLFVRGTWKARRKGNDPIFEGSFSLPLMQFTNGSQEVAIDALDGTGAVGSAWTKHLAAIEHWNIGIRFQVEGTDLSDAADHSITFEGCVCSWELSEGENAITMINVTFNAPKFSGLSKSGPS